MVKTFKGHESDIICVTVSPDGEQVASGSSDMSIKVICKLLKL